MADEEWPVVRRVSGIAELLRRWDWELPDGYEPVRIEDCRRCHELTLVVHGAGKTLRLNRDARLHHIHPRTTSLPIGDEIFDETRDIPVRVLRA